MPHVDHMQKMSEFVSTLRYEELPDAVVAAAKRCVLDALGCGLYGSTLPWCATVLRTMADLEDTAAGVSVWGTDRRLSPAAAALVNGTQVHSFEFDDLHKEAIIHPGGVSLPAILALAESWAPQADGRDLITAVVAAYEISIRVGLATGLGLLHQGWHNNGVLGTFGGAAGGARILGLGPAEVSDALGMAASQSAGLMSAQYGSMVKRMHAGKAAQSGLYAAALAANGFRGIRNVFDVDYGGFHNTFTSEYSLDELSRGLNETWEIERVGFKPYPACGSNHTSVDAIIALLAEHDFKPGDVESVDIKASTATRDHVGWPYVPDTVTTAQMNLPFAVASAIVSRGLTVANFAPEALVEAETLRLAGRVRIEADPEIDARGRAHRHEVHLSVRLADGTQLATSVTHARGSEHFPLSDEELEAKFLDIAGQVIGGPQALALANRVQHFETEPSAAEFSRAFTIGGRGGAGRGD